MLPGYVQAGDIQTAILAMEFELVDIEELETSATGDAATALQFRRTDIQQSLQVLQDRQAVLRLRPRGAATVAALQRLPPVPIDITNSPVRVPSESERQEDAGSERGLPSPSSTISTSSTSISKTTHTDTKPSLISQISQGLRGLYADVPKPSTQGSSLASAGKEASGTTAQALILVSSSKKNIDDVLVTKSAAVQDDEEGEESDIIVKSDSYSCPVCVEDVESLAKLSCSHEYCPTCLQRIFNDACTAESQFPPRCCTKDITLDEVQNFLTPKLVASFRVKELEYGTPPGHRTYCSTPDCAAFILKDNVAGQEATCGVCEKVTCTLCKQAAHKDDCPRDHGLKQVIELGERLDWKRCKTCNAMISIIGGCNQMMYVFPDLSRLPPQ